MNCSGASVVNLVTELRVSLFWALVCDSDLGTCPRPALLCADQG